MNIEKNEYKLSLFQERMWMLNSKRPEDVSYNIPVVFLLEGLLDVNVLNKSLTHIMDRHETLRSRFAIGKNGEPIQIISPLKEFDIKILDVNESEIPDYINKNANYVFDLSTGPIFIGSLLRVGSLRHVLLLNVHHIAADGWSIESILFSELQKCYEAFFSNSFPSLNKLPIQYKDFSNWQRNFDMEKSLDYWRNNLKDYDSSLEITSDYLRTSQSGSSTERFEFHYSREFSEALDKFAVSNGCTMFMALLAGFSIVINRYIGKEEFCIGTTTSGRILPEIEGMIGFFINILPLRITIDEDQTVEELLKTIRKVSLNAFENQIVPFEKLVYSNIIEKKSNSEALLPIVIRHQNFPRASFNSDLPGGLKFGSYPGFEGYRTATGKGVYSRCEIEMSYTGNKNKLDLEIMYSSDLYTKETIENIVRHHEKALIEMMKDNKQKISLIDILTSNDYEMFKIFNNTTKILNKPENFIERWNMLIQRCPESIACCDNFGNWKYCDIENFSNYIVNNLITLGIKKGDIIGICMDRYAPILSVMMAVWKVGALYVPLDPNYPETYLNLIFDNSNPKVIICNNKLKTRLNLNNEECIVVENDLHINFDKNENYAFNYSQVDLDIEDIAYIMYTSGSTGTPKGVRVPHKQLINWLNGIEKNWPFQADDVIAQKTTISFAVSVKEIFTGLLNGCKLAFIENECVKDNALFAGELIKTKSSRLNIVPSHLQSLLMYLKKESLTLPSLKVCITAGEPLTSEIVELFREIVPTSLLINNYGCTELNDITYYDTKAYDYNGGFVSIGKPILNTIIHVLDRQGRLVPIGVPGEIHVSGQSVSLGYHNLDMMTNERYLENNFDSNKILYNTGDVARYLKDGNLEYLGRWDLQVKVRGNRVDVRHVEKILGEYDGIGIRAVTGEGGQLIAYFIKTSQDKIDIKKLRDFLESKLPIYMVPTAFIELNEMPKLPNGKLNRKALNMSLGKIQQSKEFEAPKTKEEKVLVEIWSEILELPEESIGRNAHFFEMGGHSLAATRLISRIKERFSKEIGMSYIFENPKLSDLGDFLSNECKELDKNDNIIKTKMTIQKSKINNNKISRIHFNNQTPTLLKDKVILITGGSRGIGRSAARLLSSQGAIIAINYFKSDEHAKSIKDTIEEDGGIAEIFQGDITKQEQVDLLIENVIDKFGKIDVLVSNAAVGFKVSPFLTSNWGEFEFKLNNELKSFYMLTKAVVPYMMENGSGSIIAVSSTMSKKAQLGYSAHSASKAALDAFVRAIAQELGPDGIRVNIVAPGLILTDASATMENKIKENSAKHSPMKRNGLPKDVAGSILFFASDLSAYMTGVYMPVDGGHTMI